MENNFKSEIKRFIFSVNTQSVIIDEAHGLVSRMMNMSGTSKIAPLLKEWIFGAKNARFIMLTGTPVVNSPRELGMLFNILYGPIEGIRLKLNKYEIWKEISQKNLAFAIIYEDDVNFHTNFKKISNDVFLDIPHDFQILYLGGRNTCVYPKYVDPITNNISIHHPTILSGIDSDRTTHAYVISQSCCNILIEMIESQEEFNVPLDHMMLNYLLSLKIPVLNSNPLICYSDNANGDITRR